MPDISEDCPVWSNKNIGRERGFETASKQNTLHKIHTAMKKKLNTIEHNLKVIKQRIVETALACGRQPESIQLVSVSKTRSAEEICTAFQFASKIMGENYIQEAQEKFHQLKKWPVQWHLIGHLQRNKAKYAVRIFDLIHSVDSLKLAAELDKQAKKIQKIQKILVQVNISKELTKSGVDQEELLKLIQNIAKFENLHVQGLMTMPPYYNDPELARPIFSTLRLLRDRIQSDLRLPLHELSMGMTGDFEVAIQEGATLVRIGTAIFGKRV
jgi:pyridoxal phosphate enzyme (YggS family)